jgi:hypothetical protein
LEVVGPDVSLSTVLIAMPYQWDASRRESWQAAMATAVDSCDRMAAAFVLRLGDSRRQQLQSGIGFHSDGF